MSKIKYQRIRTQILNCQNCGVRDNQIKYYEHVKQGINLCDDCADLPFSKVKKNGDSINWVKVNGEYFPTDLPIAGK